MDDFNDVCQRVYDKLNDIELKQAVAYISYNENILAWFFRGLAYKLLLSPDELAR